MFGPWAAETGSGHLIAAARRREGDHATPTGVFGFGHTIYGMRPDPGGLHYRYHRLVCGDWWDEDPYSARYNRFVHVPCGVAPGFGGDSEALWTERSGLPVLRADRFQRRADARRPRRTGFGDLPAQLGVGCDRWLCGAPASHDCWACCAGCTRPSTR